MALLSVLLIALALIGYIWVAYLVWQDGSKVDAVIAFLVPCPLLGVIFWQRFGWKKKYRIPMALYIGGSAIEIARRVMN